jgi:hypothetical protein
MNGPDDFCRTSELSSWLVGLKVCARVCDSKCSCLFAGSQVLVCLDCGACLLRIGNVLQHSSTFTFTFTFTSTFTYVDSRLGAGRAKASDVPLVCVCVCVCAYGVCIYIYMYMYIYVYVCVYCGQLYSTKSQSKKLSASKTCCNVAVCVCLSI